MPFGNLPSCAEIVPATAPANKHKIAAFVNMDFIHLSIFGNYGVGSARLARSWFDVVDPSHRVFERRYNEVARKTKKPAISGAFQVWQYGYADSPGIVQMSSQQRS